MSIRHFLDLLCVDARVLSPRLSMNTSLIKEVFDEIMVCKSFNKNSREYDRTINMILANLIYNTYKHEVSTIIPKTDAYKADYGFTGSRIKNALNRLLELGYISKYKSSNFRFKFHIVYWFSIDCPILDLINSNNYEGLLMWDDTPEHLGDMCQF